MTMTNAEWCIKNGYKFYNLCIVRDCQDADDDPEKTYIITINGNKDLDKYIATDEISYLEVMLKWLDMEHKEPILDDAERRYLSAVIRPFRDDVRYIVKYGGNFSYRAYEYIAVRYQDKMCGDTYSFILPRFEKGTMYKGMEVNRHYTLEELGL